VDDIDDEIIWVKTVPVNYAIRFSGPVTPSPPAVVGMVLESFNLPAPVLC
jgi:hypothetical protein